MDKIVGTHNAAHIIQKYKDHGTVANLPGRDRKRNIDDKFKGRIIQMVTKEPRTTSKEIRGELQGQGPSVSHHPSLFEPKWTSWKTTEDDTTVESES